MTGEIPPEDLEKLRKVLDKFVQDGRMDAGGKSAKGDWVTINGTHVLLGEGGVAMSGGKLTGMTFANAKSQKKGNAGASGGSSGGGSSGGKSSGGSSEKSGGDVYASGKTALVNVVKASGNGKEEAASYLDKMGAGARVSYTSYGTPLTYEKQENGKWSFVKANGALSGAYGSSSMALLMSGTGGTDPDSITVTPATSKPSASSTQKPSATPSVNSTQKPSEQGNFVNSVNIGNPFSSATTPQPEPAAKSAENAQKSASSPKAQATSQPSPSAASKQYASIAEERNAVSKMTTNQQIDYLLQTGQISQSSAQKMRDHVAQGSKWDTPQSIKAQALKALDMKLEEEQALSKYQAGVPKETPHNRTKKAADIRQRKITAFILIIYRFMA